MFDGNFKKYAVMTGGLQFVNAFSFFVLIWVLTFTLPKESIGIYGNFRALLLYLYVGYTWAMDIAMARYLGFYKNDSNKQKIIFSTIIVILFCISVFSTVLLYFLRSFFMNFLGGSISFYIFTLLSLFFTGIFRITYSFYQGTDQINKANVFQFIVYSLGNFLVVIGVLTHLIDSLEHTLLCISLVLSVTVFPLLILLKKNFVFSFEFRTVLKYSMPRIPHIILSGLIMSSGILLGTYFFSYDVAGDFTIVTRLFRIVSVCAFAFNMLLLPKVSNMVGEKKYGELRHVMTSYVDGVMCLATAAMFMCYLAGPVFVRLGLPESYQQSILIIKMFSLGIAPYTFYIMFRATIHALDEKPYQTYIDIIAFIVLLSVFAILFKFNSNPIVSISLSMVAAFICYGCTSYVVTFMKVGFDQSPIKWVIHFCVMGLLIVLIEYNEILALVVFIVFEIFFILKYQKNLAKIFLFR